jgi:hypothetical protein
MGTRSTIALEYADGTVDQIYCHWDGYLDHNGEILRQHYMDPFKVRDLMDLGDMSSLGPQLGTQHTFDIQAKYGTPEYEAEAEAKRQVCTFYGRDRNESGVQRKRFVNFEAYKNEHQYEEYEYILRNIDGKGVWFVSSYVTNGYVPLEEAFAMEKEYTE